jgi:hypothetical protein
VGLLGLERDQVAQICLLIIPPSGSTQGAPGKVSEFQLFKNNFYIYGCS